MAEKNYITLKELAVYQLSGKLSAHAWKIFDAMNYEKRTMGEQFIRSIDAVGANLAKGYDRYHYLDKIRFYYYSRASLAEAIEHWLELMYERKKISKEDFEFMKNIHQKLQMKRNKLFV
ncbi:MAG: four helix bundle protein [Cyclobacteriaceae bacterium]